ncbi:FAD-dependent oxidoreductase [Kitasatospora sp. NPDC093550]|uniref:FAD-dependent oxidoreductase n=1 Tax=Kitasatospora sp. NPDC093550 TaxID=3364089 RepID=UPI003829B263
MKVLVAGAGLGGLCLAHGLLRAGVDVRVLEREDGPHSRYQGFRIALNAHGLDALHACLPERLHALLAAVSGPMAGERRVVDQRLREVRRLGPADEGTATDRYVLRQLLLAGLADRVEFGRPVVGYTERADGTVEAHLGDGGSAVGDLLVGADGVGSAVRRRLLPRAEVVTLPGNAVLGRTPLTARFAALVPGFGTVVHGAAASMLLGRMEFRRPPRLAAAELAPDVRLPDTGSYLRWVVMPTEPLPAGPRPWEAVRTDLLARLDDWHPDLLDLVRQADVVNSAPLTARYAEPVPHWGGSRRVTLLGDAIHPMPPSGGQGANTALRDAALLARTLAAVQRGSAELPAAVEQYEQRMLEYGFVAVADSLRRLPDVTPAR